MALAAWVLAGCAEPQSVSEPPVLSAVAPQALRYPTTPATNIEEVVAQLDAIAQLAQSRGDRIGYFAALYRQVTLEVSRGIQSGVFDDGPRMDHFDTTFANRYFAALEAWQSGGTPPACWREAFDRTRDDDTIIIQHMLLGVNAHIGLDLAIAAAQIAPGRGIYALKRDYDRINDIMLTVIEAVQLAIADLSPDLGLLDELAGDLDEGVLGFSVPALRGQAWQNAVRYAQASPRQKRRLEFLMDLSTTSLGSLISQPVPPLDDVVLSIRESEEQDVSRVIARLNAPLP